MKPLIIIPALNAAKTLQKVLFCLPVSQTVVINDGSTDETAKIASDNGFLVLHHSKNRGLSKAIQTGIKHAMDKGFSHVLLMDADGQHPSELHPYFFDTMTVNDFVLGDRFTTLSEVPKQKIAANLFASLMIQRVTGMFIRDTACGYRGFRLSDSIVIKKSIGYSFIYSQLIVSLKSGCMPARVRVPAIYDTSQPLATKLEEVESLYHALSEAAYNDDFVRKLGDFIQRRSDIYFVFEKGHIIGRYIETLNSYIFETERSTAENYYGD